MTFRNKYAIIIAKTEVKALIFDQEYILFEILDVFYLDQSFKKKTDTERNFDAISFRFKSETKISSGKQEIELCDNSICYFPSGLSYTRVSQKDELIVVHFKAFNYRSNNLEYFFPSEPGKYADLFKQLLKCWESKEISYKSDCAAIFNKIFAQFYRDNTSLCKNKKISDGVLYMQKNCLKQDFSVADAAKQSFMSETYFRKLFKKEHGISPKKHVIYTRIKHAEALILTNYYTISEIAEMCGYSDYNHFSTEFKKITGVSPSRFKYKYEKNEQ